MGVIALENALQINSSLQEINFSSINISGYRKYGLGIISVRELANALKFNSTEIKWTLYVFLHWPMY